MAMNHVNLMAIAGQNMRNLKDARDKQEIPYASLHQIVLIGRGHARVVFDIVEAADSANFGTIIVRQGEGKSGNRGTLTVMNFHGGEADKKLFIAEIRKVSDRNVVFA
jgi:hypothetical protein